MRIKKRLQQHQLLPNMEGDNDRVHIESDDHEECGIVLTSILRPKVKALMIVILVILALTFGVYYMGKLNIIGMDLSHKGELDIVDTYMLGFLNTVVSFLVLVLFALICFGIYNLYNNLVDSFS